MKITDKLTKLKSIENGEINNFNLVLSDFDNTIQPHSDRGYTHTFEVMLELKRFGYICGIITGRPGNNLKAKCKELNIWHLVKELDFVITDNGNSAFIPKEAKEYINVGIDPIDALEIIKYTTDKKISAVLNTDRGIFTHGIDYNDKTPLEKLLYEEIETFEIEKFTGKFLQINIGEPLENSTIKLDEKLTISKWDDKFYAVGLKGGKANAYNAIVQEYKRQGIIFENMYAFGDQNNDIEMFELDYVTSIAVSNATDQLKKLATKISSYSVYDDSVGHELINLVLGNNFTN